MKISLTDLDKFEKEIIQKISRLELEEAINSIVDGVHEIINDPGSVALVFGSKRLDELCLKIGKTAYERIKHELRTEAPINSDTVVSIASYLAPYGGHTLVLEDLIKAQPNKKHIILITDLFRNIDIGFLEKRFGHLAQIKILPNVNSLKKLDLLMIELAELAPEQIFLFNHHQDAVAISAIQPSLDKMNIMFYHHADHHLCLGVHLPYVKHIDPHNLGFYNCNIHEELHDNYYLPLIIEDRGTRSESNSFCKDDQLKTCSCGTSNKFFSSYKFPYKELIVSRLQIREGVHIHVGDIPDECLKEILEAINDLGIEPSRFVHISWVPSLWKCLVDFNVDLYISSFPIGGGRATIEAMGSSTPLLMHQNNASSFHGGVDCAYNEAFVWSNRDEFERILKVISPSDLARHSILSRNHYEANHSPDKLTAALQLMLSEEATIKPPLLKKKNPDYLERYLQMRSLIIEKLKRDYDIQVQGIEKKFSEELNLIHSSRSWKLTALLRRISKLLRNFRD